MKPVVCSINPNLFWSMNPLEAQQMVKALKWPGLTSLEKEALGGWWALGAEGPHRATVLGACGAWKTHILLWASRAGGEKGLTWAGPYWERSGIGRFEASSKVLQIVPLFPSRSKTAQVQPSPPLLCQSSLHHLTTRCQWKVSVSVSEKNRRVDVFRVGCFIFSRECFCYLPVPCETSHAAPTAAELLFFTFFLLVMGDRPELGSELGCLSKS